ncbi:hypothetical protein [Pedobacter sp. NJ-S-72]
MVINTDPAGPKRLLGILIRNPEPFNNPKLPVELLSDTVELSLTLPDQSVQLPQTFIYIHSRDTSAVFITNTAMNLPAGDIKLHFRNKIFNGNDYLTEHTDYTSPVIPIKI